MLTMLLAFLGSSGFGSILGGFMGWLNRKVDLEAKRLDLEHETKRWAHEGLMRDADLKTIQAEAAGRREVAIVEGESAAEVARMAALSAAYASDALDPKALEHAGWWRWTLVLADAMRRFIRPGATVLLLVGTMYVNWLLIEKLTGSSWSTLDATQRHELALQAISWLGAQTSAALSYWFVSRGSSK